MIYIIKIILIRILVVTVFTIFRGSLQEGFSVYLSVGEMEVEESVGFPHLHSLTIIWKH